jgi:hypothetical protein
MIGGSSPRCKWRELPSEAKRAYGFGEESHVADSIVQGLELEESLAPAPDLSLLFLRGGNMYTTIHTIDENLIVISSAFEEVDHGRVFLIYDASDRSLLMIPSMPRTSPPIHTARVLVARRRDGDKSYALVFPGRKFVSWSAKGNPQYQDVLFVSPSSSTSPWQMDKKVKIPQKWHSDDSSFVAEEVFSAHGRAYWVDLLRGVMYCDCNDILSADIDCVDVRTLDLPVGCEKYMGSRDEIAEVAAFRAMGAVGDSIKFVSIDGYLEPVDLKDCKVRIWRLTKDMNWDVEYELSLISLWEGLEFKGGFFPRLTPMYPFLSALDDHVVYFALGDFTRLQRNGFPTDPSYMVRVDFHHKTFECRHVYHWRHTSMAGLLAVSRNGKRKLSGLSQGEDLKPCPSVS